MKKNYKLKCNVKYKEMHKNMNLDFVQLNWKDLNKTFLNPFVLCFESDQYFAEAHF